MCTDIEDMVHCEFKCQLHASEATTQVTDPSYLFEILWRTVLSSRWAHAARRETSHLLLERRWSDFGQISRSLEPDIVNITIKFTSLLRAVKKSRPEWPVISQMKRFWSSI